MDRTLLLNATFEPLNALSWKEAVILLYPGKVEVVKGYERDKGAGNGMVKYRDFVQPAQSGKG